MGIYLPNMEMPVTCCHCPLMGYDPDIEWVDGGRETQGAYICVITHELIDNTKREEHCPLVPVPPHGRLIDADALSAKLNMMLSMAFGEGNTAFHFAYRSLGKVMENAPTIIPAEEGET